MNFKQVLNALLVLTLFAGACSDDPEPTNRCADVECEGGVCDSATGECINPASCEDADDCLSGFVCEDNACVEAVTNDCRLDGCERGECDNGSGECVNAGSCTAGSEEVRCLEGFRCVSAVCTDEASFCEDLDCQRGECSFEELECVDSETCEADSDCLAGNYCDDGTCAANTCDANMVDCARGVCDAATGECVNPESCAAATECLDDNLCVGGACTPASEACECPGNQICQYDEGTLSVSCEVNPEGCGNAYDCLGADVCVEGACVAPEACVADEFEPNDTEEDAVDYQIAGAAGRLSDLSVCDADVDRFTFDTRLDLDDLGTLRAEVEIASSMVGQGVIEVSLIGPNGNEVASGRNVVNGVQTNIARADFGVTNLGRGVYTIVIEGSDLSTAGLTYSLSVDLLDNEIVSACSNAQLLEEGEGVTGITSSGESLSASSSCADDGASTPEDLYQFELTEAGYVSVVAVPATQVNLAVSIRRECARDETEVSCVDSALSGGVETLATYLEPGRYFIVVEGASATSGGSYGLTYTVESVTCVPNESTCLDETQARVCDPRGTGTNDIVCENGCDAGTGRCLDKLGDTCDRPIVVSSFPHVETFTWGDFGADYEAADSCVPDDSISDKSGPDLVFQVTVPPGEALVATLPRNGSYVSLFISDACPGLEAACVAGVNSGTFDDEELIYENQTGQDLTLFLVADRGGTNNSSNPGTITITTREIQCLPETTRCVLEREIQTCNDLGTGWDESEFCPYGCEVGSDACNLAPNSLCGAAELLTPGTTIQGDLRYLSADYSTGTCQNTGSTTSSAAGREAVYRLVLTEPGIATVTVNSSYNAVLWYTDTCTNDALNTCLARVNQTTTTTGEETLQFITDGPGEFYVVVDASSSTTSSGTFTISAEVLPAECVPGEGLGCTGPNTLSFCSDLAMPTEYTCSSGCQDGACVDPLGDICADPIPLSGTGSQTYAFNGAVKQHFVPVDGVYGECTLEDAPGFDRIFRVDLEAGEVFTANISTTSSYLRFYAVRTCGDMGTCFGVPSSTNDNFAYLAEQAETIYFVVQYGLSSSTTSTTYNLNWDIRQTSFACLPGSSTCADEFTVERCRADGTGYELVSCPEGCNQGACEITPGDLCADAIDVGAGLTFTYDPSDINGDYSFPSLSCGGTSTGRDSYFKVDMLAGDILEVNARHETTTHYPVISLFEDCSDPAGGCLAFDRGLSTNRRPSVRYQSPVDQTVLISVDATSSTATSRLFGSIELVSPSCTSGVTACTPDQTALVSCIKGQEITLPCDGGCFNGACANPKGDSCFDAIALDRNETSTQPIDFQGNNFAVNPKAGVTNQCQLSYTYNGIDVFYSVDLLAGERLQAELSGLTTAYLFLFEGCDFDSCLAHEPVLRRSVDYVAPVNQTVYLVIDRTSTTPTSTTSTINYTITPTSGSCTPGRYVCLDADTSQRCNEDGQTSGALYDCPWGCNQAFGRCRPAPPSQVNSCATAPVITDSFAAYGSHDQESNEVALTSGSCAGTTSPGSDFFYAISLEPNDYIEVRMQRAAPNTSLFYLFSSCSDAEGTCVAAEVTSTSNNDVMMNYQAGSQPETIYLGVDTSTSTSDRVVLFEVEYLNPVCIPGVDPNRCLADASALEYCDSTGFWREFGCSCDLATDRCLNPAGETCQDPIVVSTSSVAQGSFLDYADDYDLPVTNACTSSRTPGSDAVYEVQLLANQTLTATVTSSDGEDLAIYITDVCEFLPATCIDGSDVSTLGAETVTYTATANESVFVIVDSYFTGLTGDFTVDFVIQ
ncbi:hypothetical protein FRD01_10345 [Microvenator marinus]|uniref:Peptidase C-terminal archaeal/bacterial domain-containing protein n=1 Tax=Microvenator marinus TaxID=2600177 RepID=A0A5B8XP17_9DELT|nr:hypothetical protein [Microvenator marinus]QED27632.1 hypothetical protein FRD01_10345 [Microvenator marinus]